MAHIHIAATPGVTIDGFRAVAAKHNPPQDIDGLLAWAAGTDEKGLHVVTVWESKATRTGGPPSSSSPRSSRSA